ncbi:MAG TPA: LysE family transporter, partial [Roseiarcus sp.]|nr:LysE family transporter [Roseiarcus sp.]
EAVRPATPAKAISDPPQAKGLTSFAAFRQGLISDLSNPKMAVFFASLLPQFAPFGAFLPLLTLGAIFAVMTFSWLALYAAALARAGNLLRRSAVRRAIEGVTGFVLVGLGLRLVVSRE